MGSDRTETRDLGRPARAASEDEALSFRVSHCLAAHRPLASIQRAWLALYPHMARAPASERVMLTEQRSVDEVLA